MRSYIPLDHQHHYEIDPSVGRSVGRSSPVIIITTSQQ